MRPLPVERVAGAPACVLGLAIVRGSPVPVVSLAALVGTTIAASPSRFVILRVGTRRVALAVDAVRGVAAVDEARLEPMPPLLQNLAAVDGIYARDEALMMVLSGARLLPDEVLAC